LEERDLLIITGVMEYWSAGKTAPGYWNDGVVE